MGWEANENELGTFSQIWKAQGPLLMSCLSSITTDQHWGKNEGCLMLIIKTWNRGIGLLLQVYCHQKNKKYCEEEGSKYMQMRGT
mmetsp:Transcript_11550/g.17800  ORF Transcript_11550/g.17800 Transcript_11550/m.17800 type:complete len:85 (+) Transcript_11550:373-627(+)